MKTELPSAITIAGETEILKAYGDEVRILVRSEQSGGKFVMFTDVTPPHTFKTIAINR